MTDTEPFIAPGDHDSMTDQEKVNHYKNRKCRHPDCRAATSAHHREYAARRRAAQAPSTEVEADNPADEAKPDDESTTPTAELEPATPKPAPAGFAVAGGKTSSLGSTRRLRALMVIGWTPKDMAHESRLPLDGIWRLLVAPPVEVQYGNHAAIADAYKRLRVSPKAFDAPGSAGLAARWARAVADSHGWAGPFDWEYIDVDDDPKVCRRLPAALTAAQLAEAFDIFPIPSATVPATVPALEAGVEVSEADELRATAQKLTDDLVTAEEALAAERLTSGELREQIRRLELAARPDTGQVNLEEDLEAARQELQTAQDELAAERRRFTQQTDQLAKTADQRDALEQRNQELEAVLALDSVPDGPGFSIDEDGACSSVGVVVAPEITVVIENGRVTVTAPAGIE